MLRIVSIKPNFSLPFVVDCYHIALNRKISATESEQLRKSFYRKIKNPNHIFEVKEHNLLHIEGNFFNEQKYFTILHLFLLDLSVLYLD